MKASNEKAMQDLFKLKSKIGTKMLSYANNNKNGVNLSTCFIRNHLQKSESQAALPPQSNFFYPTAQL